MVKYFIFFIFLWPTLLTSAEFTANVKRLEVNLHEPFALNLILKDASPNGTPTLDLLNQEFIMNSQQQSSNTVLMNGRFSSNISWQISLTPRAEGEFTIPSIKLNTSSGELSTTPIKIKVVKGNASNPNSISNSISVATNVSNLNPYKNEPIFLSVQMDAKIDVANVQLQKFSIEDAIVEVNGEPKVETKIVHGVRRHIIEFNYLVTPLKAGSLKIPSITLQGGIPSKRQAFRGGLDDDFEPLASMLGFTQLKPFTVVTQEKEINVLPPALGLNPWLPAKSIILEEGWDASQTLQVGEPVVRGFKIVAEGVMSNQLPSLNILQAGEKGVKIYGDKPELQDKITGQKIFSSRKEQYTLIPQQAGLLTLPEITLEWWDITKNEKSIASIPARTLLIPPQANNENENNVVAFGDEDRIVSNMPHETSQQRDPILLVVVSVLAVLLFAAIIWGIALRNKIMRMSEKHKDKIVEPKIPEFANEKNKSPQELPLPVKMPKIAKDKREKLPDLNPT